MSTVNTGGPAFPLDYKLVEVTSEVIEASDLSQSKKADALSKLGESCTGMTLRDYFAAKAMDGFNREMVAYEWGEDVTAHAAKRAYEIADAMLKARETE